MTDTMASKFVNLKQEKYQYSRIAGVFYFFLSILSGVSFFYRDSLIITGDAAQTTQNIQNAGNLYIFTFVADLFGQVCFIFVVFYLYQVFKDVNKINASLMVILALVGIPITMLNMMNHLIVYDIINDSTFLGSFTKSGKEDLVYIFLDIHRIGILISSIFWGLWLIPTGKLILESKYLPKFIGVFLIIGGVSYIIDFLVHSFNLSISSFTEPLVVITSIGEFSLMFILLFKGININQIKQTGIATMVQVN